MFMIQLINKIRISSVLFLLLLGYSCKEKKISTNENSADFVTKDSFVENDTTSINKINKENKYAEVGYELLPDFQGKGIMTSALRKIINLAFTELNIETIKALTHSENLPSRKLLEKFDFKLMLGKTDPDNSNNIIYCLKKACP